MKIHDNRLRDTMCEITCCNITGTINSICSLSSCDVELMCVEFKVLIW